MSDGQNFLATPQGEFIRFPAGPRAPDPAPARPFCGHWQRGRVYGTWRCECGSAMTFTLPRGVIAALQSRNPFNA